MALGSLKANARPSNLKVLEFGGPLQDRLAVTVLNPDDLALHSFPHRASQHWELSAAYRTTDRPCRDKGCWDPGTGSSFVGLARGR